MPTKEELTKELRDRALYVLGCLFADIRRYGTLYTFQQLYELCAVIVSYDNGANSVADRVCRAAYPEWSILVAARNTISHNVYNSELLGLALGRVTDSPIIKDLCRDILGDESLADVLLCSLTVAIGDLSKS